MGNYMTKYPAGFILSKLDKMMLAKTDKYKNDHDISILDYSSINDISADALQEIMHDVTDARYNTFFKYASKWADMSTNGSLLVPLVNGFDLLDKDTWNDFKTPEDVQKFQNHFNSDGKYDIGYMYKLFRFAYMSDKTLNSELLSEDIRALLGNRRLIKNKQEVYLQAFKDYVKEGGDVESLRLMINYQTLASGMAWLDTPDDDLEKEIATYEELHDILAKQVTSPYDEIFEEAKAIVEMKKNDADYALSEEISKREVALNDKIKEFDPEMLKQVFEAREKNLKIEGKWDLNASKKDANHIFQPTSDAMAMTGLNKMLASIDREHKKKAQVEI